MYIYLCIVATHLAAARPSVIVIERLLLIEPDTTHRNVVKCFGYQIYIHILHISHHHSMKSTESGSRYKLILQYWSHKILNDQYLMNTQPEYLRIRTPVSPHKKVDPKYIIQMMSPIRYLKLHV